MDIDEGIVAVAMTNDCPCSEDVKAKPSVYKLTSRAFSEHLSPQ